MSINIRYIRNIWLICVLLLHLSSCLQDGYDLSRGVNTELSIGGDSLVLPLGMTGRIFLSSILDTVGQQLIQTNPDGLYALRKKDSLLVNIDTVKAVSIEIDPIKVDPVEVQLADIQFPPFQLPPVSSSTALTIPEVNVSSRIEPLDIKKNYTYTVPSRNAGLKSKSVIRSKSDGLYAIGPVDMNESTETGQSFSISNYPNSLNRINKLFLTNNRITIRFDKSKINDLGFASQNDQIANFRIDFPAEYVLSSPEGKGASIEGSSFIIRNAPFPENVDEISFRLKVDYVDFSRIPQSGSLAYERTIPYQVDYQFSGEIDNLSKIEGKDLTIGVSISSSPVFDDMEVVTQAIGVDIPNGKYEINKEITGIPSEIAKVSTIKLEDDAVYQLSIDNPEISPFEYNGGVCRIQLPKSITFKPTEGLNTSTNILTIPYNQLNGSRTIGIASIRFDQTLPEDVTSLFFADELSYEASGFTLAPTTVKTSVIESMTDRKFKITGTCSTLKAKDASITSRKISYEIPEINTDVNIERFVSSDMKNVYAAALKIPAETRLRIDVTGLPAKIDSVFFYNYTIKLPDCMKFAIGTTNSKNEIILNRGFKVSNGFLKDFKLESFDFGENGLELKNGVFSLKKQVSVSGSVYVKSAQINASELNNIKVLPVLTVAPFELSQIECKIDPGIAPITQTIKLDMPKFLKDNDVILDVLNPVITLQADNPMGAPMDVDIELIPKRNGVVIPNASVTATLKVNAATRPGIATSSRFWLSKDDSGGVSGGYQSVAIPNLPDLLKKTPDEVEIRIIPTVTGENHLVNLASQSNQIAVKYDLHVPFEFGEDFKIAYTDTVGDLQSKLAEIIDYTRELVLYAVVENQIPLEMMLDVVPLDNQKHPVSGITITVSDKIKSENIDGSSQKSAIQLNVKESEPGALEKLDALAIYVNAQSNSTIAGMPLKETQYFTLALKAGIPKGIMYKFK